MKRIISLVVVVAMMLSMSSFVVLADYASTLTTTVTADKVAQGEQFTVRTSVGTTNGMATIGFKIAFDLDDVELGVSPASAAAAEEYKDFIGTSDFPTLDDVTNTILGRPAHIDDDYFDSYTGLLSTKKLGDPSIAYEEKDGVGYIYFGYAINPDNAKNALNKVENQLFGGAVLKVKTAEKKQTTISIVQATASGKDGVDTASTLEPASITLDLNGYGEVVEPEDPYDLKTNYVAAAKDIPVTSQYGTYNVNTALIFGSSINAGSADVFGTEITLKGYEGEPIDLVASDAAKYEPGVGITGFTAAVTSIREANLGGTFVAKAYAIDANGKKVYGAEKEAIFNEVIAAN